MYRALFCFGGHGCSMLRRSGTRSQCGQCLEKARENLWKRISWVSGRQIQMCVTRKADHSKNRIEENAIPFIRIEAFRPSVEQRRAKRSIAIGSETVSESRQRIARETTLEVDQPRNAGHWADENVLE